MVHPLFSPEIRMMLAEKNAIGLREFCEELHPATVAEALDDEFSPEQIWEVISNANIRTQASVFEYLTPAQQVLMAEKARPQMGELLSKMSHDDRVDLLRRLPGRVTESVMRLVAEADRKDIATLFQYGENTVGALMTTDYAWLPGTLTAAEAIDQLRQEAPDRETIYYIYVLDDPNRRGDGSLAPRRLLGVVSLRDLILAPRHALIRELMETDLVTLRHDEDQEQVAQLFARYDFLAAPVVDEQFGLLGIVTHDDVLDVVREEATEDLQRQAAVGPIESDYLNASFYRVWRSRVQWLAVLFVAELATFTVMEFFEELIATVVVLALFVPLCISTGGNSGTQAATLVTRAMALGFARPRDWKRVLRRELLMGLALGLTLGVIAFVRGSLTPSDTRSGPRKVKEEFTVRVPAGTELSAQEVSSLWGGKSWDVSLAKGTPQTVTLEKNARVRLPEGVKTLTPPEPVGGEWVYRFPTECEVRTEPVSRWRLGLTVSIAVLGICLWGTLMGCLIPLVLQRFGLDPAVASGALVATLVDVSGIFIFFSAAWLILL
ncbi:Magnesium transporter MgtE [Gemmata obscuriglobus]|uniref:Magnesium transporter MgtE n=1 Tax=Gemmata obscuriglobus TaxID=114 RepID=A0A2Z3H3P1_9BACT|nr:magnesium transporter [Gemmata obscuriglobus]AWM38206.1 magnesium transporter [Gemmata obscuriglobus]QEG28892.1 Magnesium transporter MgtE [Gemmata obscuriglobus]VTS07355.1 magnesium transporter : Magnesium transporter OS=Desulfovibrio alkalitolerans DSM 16529 GN=dsat_2403 PE=4 SV=1: MgtE_N: CBS: CBS: MgtE: MgtE [Gemmata obscuriglobus UQM 2246]